MNDSAVKIEVHLIQNFAPSNLNRDDTGQPKSAYFGGFRRARISSQSGKRAVRMWWKERGTVTVGDRTKRIQEKLFDSLSRDKADKEGHFRIQVTDWSKAGNKGEPIPVEEKVIDEAALRDGIRVFTEAYYAAADKKKPDQTSVLVFISPEELKVCAQAILSLWNDTIRQVEKKGTAAEVTKGIGNIVAERRVYDLKAKGKKKQDDDSGEENEGASNDEEGQAGKDDKLPKLKADAEVIEAITNARVSADIALFGRMLAEQPGRNTDGACQVAHPISTHKVDMEMDFYTAVDDLNPAEETGAGMMGVIGFNSACYYRYALVDRDQLARNLARKTGRNKNGEWVDELKEIDYDEADEVIKAFLEAMVYAIPTGKQKSFAAQNLPSFGLFVRRQGGVPISLANAFASPIRPTKDDDDLVGRSVDALTKHWGTLVKVYGDQGSREVACFHIGQEDRLNGLSSRDMESVKAAIDEVIKVKVAAK